MKNQGFLHRMLGFVKSELEITLAILVLLAFVVGFSFAQTPEVEVSQVAESGTTFTDNITVNGAAYSGVAFGMKKSGFYTASGFSGGAQYATAEGMNLVNSGSTYELTINLSQPLGSGKWFLDGDGDIAVNINGTLVTSVSQAFSLEGAQQIKISTKGGVTLRALSHTPGKNGGTGATTAASVKTLYVAPQVTQLTVGTSRALLVIALDDAGNSISTNGIATWTSSNPSIAKVDAASGLIEAVSAGSVQISVKINGAQASATINVQARDEAITTPTETKPVTPIVTLPVEEAEKESSTPAEETGAQSPATEEVEPPVPFKEEITKIAPDKVEQAELDKQVSAAVTSLFSEKAVAQRFTETGRTIATQSEISKAVAQLPTLTQKVTFRAKAAVAEVAQTIREIVIGTKVTDPSTGIQVEKPSALKMIGTFIGNLITGGGASGSQAGTMSGKLGDGEIN